MLPLMTTTPAAARAAFLNAYLVAADAVGSPPIGVVRKDGNVWRVLRLGVPADQQPREAFATRAEAGARLMELERS